MTAGVQMDVGYDSFFGWDGMYIESELPNPHHRVQHCTEETIDGVEVSLVNDDNSFKIRQTTRDDVFNSMKKTFVFDDSEDLFATGVNNPSAASQAGSESSAVSSDFSSSQRSYLQLAIPATWQQFDVDGVECGHRQSQGSKNDGFTRSRDLENTACDRSVGHSHRDVSSHQPYHYGESQEMTYQPKPRSPACDRSVGSSHRDVSSNQPYHYEDSQEVIYEPKSRPLFLGPRRIRVSMHSRMEWWNHQLSKPIRALTGGKRSLLSPLGDCLGQGVVQTISTQPRRPNDDSKVDHADLDWADFSSQLSIDTLMEQDCETIKTETLKDQINWFAHSDAGKGGLSYQLRDLSPPIPPIQKYFYNSNLSCDSESSPGAEQDSTMNPTGSACSKIPKKIVLIEFDARTLITHKGTEDDSSDDDSADHIDWDLG